MIRNIRPSEAAIVGAAFLVIVLLFAFDPMPRFHWLGVVFGVPINKLLFAAAIVGGAVFGVRLARTDAAEKRRSND